MKQISKPEILKYFNRVELRDYDRFYELEDDDKKAYVCFSKKHVPLLLNKNKSWNSVELQDLFFKCIEYDARTNGYYQPFIPKPADLFQPEQQYAELRFRNSLHILMWLLCIISGSFFIIMCNMPSIVLIVYISTMLFIAYITIRK